VLVNVVASLILVPVAIFVFEDKLVSSQLNVVMRSIFEPIGV
jgi:hypothetical protein